MTRHVAIIGAGWAGLAAAITLSRNDIRLTLIEAAHQAGGRARRVDARGLSWDNGQHLMTGAYREMLGLLDGIGIAEQQVFQRRAMRLEMRSPRHSKVRLAFPDLPAPWHVITAFLRAEGLSWSERYRALALCTSLFLSGFQLDPDISVAEWLGRAGQPSLLIKALWEPLCLAALNTPLDRASAQIFIRVLKEVFTGRRSDSDLMFPRSDLGHVFPDPALRFLQQRGAEFHFGERALSLDIDDGRVRHVTTRHDRIAADHVIIAASPSDCLRLIEPHSLLSDTARQLQTLSHEPICTVYLQYPSHIRLGCEMLGLLDGTGQWIFDQAIAGHPGRMAVVISGPGPHMGWDNEELTKCISGEVAGHFPDWPTPECSLVIREKRATFSCRAGIKANRPNPRTAVSGLWLAGDYTDTGLPATLEGALRSGKRCASAILADIASQR